MTEIHREFELKDSDFPVPEKFDNNRPPAKIASVTQPKEVSTFSGLTQPSQTDDSNGALNGLAWWMRFYPFHNLLKYAAYLHVPGSKTSAQHRMDKYVENHPRFAKAVRIGDFCFVVLLSLLVLTTFGLGVWKTMFGTM